MDRFGLMARCNHKHKYKASIISTSKAEEPGPSYRLKQPLHDTANINSSNSNNVVKVNNKTDAGGVTITKKKKKLTPKRKAKESTTVTKTSSSATSRSVMVDDTPTLPTCPKNKVKIDAGGAYAATTVTNRNKAKVKSTARRRETTRSAADAVRLRQPAHLVAKAPAPVSRGGVAGAITGSGRPGLETQRTQRRPNIKRTNMDMGEQPQHQPAHTHHAPSQNQTRRRVNTKSQEEEEHNVDAEVHVRTRGDVIIAAARESSKLEVDRVEVIVANAIVKQEQRERESHSMNQLLRRKKEKQPLHKQRGHPKARASSVPEMQVQTETQAERVGVDNKVPEPEQEVAPPQRAMPPRTCSRRVVQAMKLKSKLNQRRRSNRALHLENNANARIQSLLFHVDVRHVRAAVLLQSAYRRYRAVYRRCEVLASKHTDTYCKVRLESKPWCNCPTVSEQYAML
jgi:hypothetical protein